MPRSNFQNCCIKVKKSYLYFSRLPVTSSRIKTLRCLHYPPLEFPSKNVLARVLLAMILTATRVALSRDSRVVSVFMLSKCRLSGVPFIKRDGFLFYIQLYYSNSVDTVGLCYFSLGLKLP